MYKKLAIAFSVANLCFFKAWSEALSPLSPAYLYFWRDYPGYAPIISLAINVFLLTTIFYACFSLLWRLGGSTFHNLARASFLIIFLRALNLARAQTVSTHELRSLFGRVGLFAIGTLLLVLLVLGIVRFGLARVAGGAAIIALVISPFGLVGLTQASWLAIKYGRIWQERPLAPILTANAKAQPRVLWLIFDEMSEDQVFGDRSAGLSLPSLDRLQAEALQATNAFPPAGHTTQSIPALLIGRLIASVRPAGPHELMLTFPAQPAAVGWTSQPDIFTEARAAGFNTAIVGWYHPYCRVLGDRLTSCLWEPANEPRRLSIEERLLRPGVDLLPMLPFTGNYRDRLVRRTGEEIRIAHLAGYQTLLAAATKAATNPTFGLTFIHLPVPHPPYIYDRRKGVWDTTEQREYLDNLALADRTLGELRLAMERAGTWEGTTIVISSDHWWRKDYWRRFAVGPYWGSTDALYLGRIDHRIPFLVRMAGQKTASRYEAPFNTVLTHDLILDIMKQRISNPEQIPAWLDMHKTIGESPYQAYDDPE